MHSIPNEERAAKLFEEVGGTTSAEELTSRRVRRAAKIVVEQFTGPLDDASSWPRA
ncbi:MAG TPA: hypothetical protein P5572_17680 [Phycisphaerae bacterium]|nr:hypothetical protein [Phycisphaerae bacterium]